MAEALALSICQVVVPVAVAAMPKLWAQIVKAFNRLPKRASDHRVNSHLAIIHTTLDSLKNLPDLLWASLGHVQALLNTMKLQAESVEKMLVHDTTLQRYFHKGKIARSIQSIVWTMQVFEMNVRMHHRASFIVGGKQNADCDRLCQAQLYQKSQENLHKDLLAKLREDNLEPVIVFTSAEYERSMRRSGAYPTISYEFSSQPASGYPKTLTVSRSVRECIEILLRWLRDLKLTRDTSSVACAGMIGVAFNEVFTEILPKALLHHLRESRSRLEPRAARQFYKNLSFFRSFSVSATFKTIQGKDGLDLEDDDKVSLDLQHCGWTTWNLVHQESVELRDRRGVANNHRLLVGSSSRGVTPTTSGYPDFTECMLCGVSIQSNSFDTELIREQHWDACYRKEQRKIARSTSDEGCPICGTGWQHLPNDQRQSHANACLDNCQIQMSQRLQHSPGFGTT